MAPVWRGLAPLLLRRCCSLLQNDSFGQAKSAVVLHLRVGDKNPAYALKRFAGSVARFNSSKLIIVTAINFSPFAEQSMCPLPQAQPQPGTPF